MYIVPELISFDLGLGYISAYLYVQVFCVWTVLV